MRKWTTVCCMFNSKSLKGNNGSVLCLQLCFCYQVAKKTPVNAGLKGPWGSFLVNKQKCCWTKCILRVSLRSESVKCISCVILNTVMFTSMFTSLQSSFLPLLLEHFSLLGVLPPLVHHWNSVATLIGLYIASPVCTRMHVHPCARVRDKQGPTKPILCSEQTI